MKGAYMFSEYRTIAAAAGILLVGLAAMGKPASRPATRPAVKQSGRLVKSIRRDLDASGKPTWPEAMKLNQTKLLLPGHTEALGVKLSQRRYWCDLTDARGEPLEKQYTVVSTLRAVSSTSSYAFSFCTPGALLEFPHTFRLFTHGVGKNYLVWTASRFIFVVEVSKGNDRTETFMRHLRFHDTERLPRQKVIAKQMFGKGVKVDLHDYLWRTQVSQLVAQDFGLTSMPEIINTMALITNDEYGISRNSIQEDMFVISMSVPKPGEMLLQFVGAKRDVIYTVSKKDRQWRITQTEPLTKKKARELAPLL